MAETIYDYPDQSGVHTGTLSGEVSRIFPGLKTTKMTRDGMLSVVVDPALSKPDKLILDGLVAAHDGASLADRRESKIRAEIHAQQERTAERDRQDAINALTARGELDETE